MEVEGDGEKVECGYAVLVDDLDDHRAGRPRPGRRNHLHKAASLRVLLLKELASAAEGDLDGEGRPQGLGSIVNHVEGQGPCGANDVVHRPCVGRRKRRKTRRRSHSDKVVPSLVSRAKGHGGFKGNVGAKDKDMTVHRRHNKVEFAVARDVVGENHRVRLFADVDLESASGGSLDDVHLAVVGRNHHVQTTSRRVEANQSHRRQNATTGSNGVVFECLSRFAVEGPYVAVLCGRDDVDLPVAVDVAHHGPLR
mmetsp:Transcript_54075/g.127712  ORF Transcript_54075/g.127712 Transcript_54075/m.127712 type:complete len:253 (-) Transcript_54075:617-1375(-)